MPAEYALTVNVADDPISSAWHGACQLAASPAFAQEALTKADYEEQGSYRIHSAAA